MENPISVSRRASGINAILSLSRTERENRARGGQQHAGAKLGFGEGALEAVVQTHDLARGFHLRAQDRVHAGEARKGEHGFLDRDMRGDRGVIELELLPPSSRTSPARTRNNVDLPAPLAPSRSSAPPAGTPNPT